MWQKISNEKRLDLEWEGKMRQWKKAQVWTWNESREKLKLAQLCV